MRQHTDITRSKRTKTCTTSQWPSCWERCSERSIRNARLKADVVLITKTIIIFLSFAQKPILMLQGSFLVEKALGPRIMRRLWSNTRERMQGKEGTR